MASIESLPLEESTPRRIINLFEATEQNDENAVKNFIQEKGVRVSETNHDEETAAHLAAKTGNVNIVKALLEKDPTILSSTNAEGDTILFLAIERGHLNVVKYLVTEHKADISQRNHRVFGCTAIHIAAQYGQLEILKYFVEEKNGDVNITNKLKETPAILAAEGKHHHIIKYLVEERNADLTTIDSDKNNILYMTVKKNDLSLMKYLLDERNLNLNVNWRNKFGGTLVHQAAILNRVNFLTYLVEEKNADVNIPDNMNVTPLHNAALRNHVETCMYLIEHGANITFKDYRDKLPVEYASSSRLIKYMKEAATSPQKRSRRNVKELFHLHSVSQVTQTLAVTGKNVNGPVSLSAQSFLALAEFLVRKATKSNHEIVRHQALLSPKEIMEHRMDPMAVQAIRKFQSREP